MPTGYTSAIKDDISFEEFALSCAKAFGACISLRDEPFNTNIPDEFKPSTYHKERAMELEKRLAKLEAMSLEEAAAEAELLYDSRVASQKESQRKDASLEEKYLSMLEKVNNWIPPTPDHRELKRFMANQIQGSIKFDCCIDYVNRPSIVKLSGTAWLVREKNSVSEDIVYHQQKYKEEVARVESRNAWIKALRESL